MCYMIAHRTFIVMPTVSGEIRHTQSVVPSYVSVVSAIFVEVKIMILHVEHAYDE